MSQSVRLPAAVQRRHAEDLRICIRFRLAINHVLSVRGIDGAAAIGKALGMDGQAALRLLTREMWREDDVAELRAAAVRMGLQVQERSSEF